MTTTKRRLGTVTREDEIPIHYTDYMTGNILSFTWYVNERGQRVKNKYIYVGELLCSPPC